MRKRIVFAALVTLAVAICLWKAGPTTATYLDNLGPYGYHEISD